MPRFLKTENTKPRKKQVRGKIDQEEESVRFEKNEWTGRASTRKASRYNSSARSSYRSSTTFVPRTSSGPAESDSSNSHSYSAHRPALQSGQAPSTIARGVATGGANESNGSVSHSPAPANSSGLRKRKTSRAKRAREAIIPSGLRHVRRDKAQPESGHQVEKRIHNANQSMRTASRWGLIIQRRGGGAGFWAPRQQGSKSILADGPARASVQVEACSLLAIRAISVHGMLRLLLTIVEFDQFPIRTFRHPYERAETGATQASREIAPIWRDASGTMPAWQNILPIRQPQHLTHNQGTHDHRP